MFAELNQLPADPILGLIAQFREDTRAHKIDLGVGVYRNPQGETPVLAAVKEAETRLLATESSKAYVGPAGNPQYNQSMRQLVLGEGHPATDSLVTVQTPGGCGALRVAAELIKRARRDATIWVSDPTWGNHMPLLGDSGLELKTYPYYDFATHSLKFDEMMATLEQVDAGDLVLLHACCHNPSGADLTSDQWQQIAALAERNGFVPFVDMAYQGFGESADADAYGIRLLCERLPEVLLAVSCSKNFGLYKERVGAVGLLSSRPAEALTHINSIVRGIYSMPPDHGASLVATILTDAQLTASWLDELEVMRSRIQQMRTEFVTRVNAAGAGGRFDHIGRQRGMFSYLGLTPEQVGLLASEHAVYMLGTSRMSLAGLNDTNLDAFVSALVQVC